VNHPYLRGGIVAIAAAIWYGAIGPSVVSGLKDESIEATRVPGIYDLQGYANSHTDRITTESRAALDEGRRLMEREERWSALIASLLTPAQRKTGLELARALPPVPPRHRQDEAEPELVALVAKLMDKYGYLPVRVPDPEKADDWLGAGRADRARAVLALADTPDLDADVAREILVATVDVVLAQRDRLRLERKAWALLEDPASEGFGITGGR
jgi:hypothetical protein